MWFKKKKEVVSNGITLEGWVNDHINEEKYLRMYIGKDGTYKRLDTFGSVGDIFYRIVEKYKNNLISTIEILDRDNKHDTTLVFIEE